MSSQRTFTFAPPSATDFPLSIDTQGLVQSPNQPSGWRSVEIDNGSAYILSVYGDGSLLRNVAPYTARFALNTFGAWQNIQIKPANAPTIPNTDSITITVFSDVVVPPLLPVYGPSAWGGGAVPNVLVDVNPGDQLLAWQVQQLIDLLTGVMTGQVVILGEGLKVQGGNLTVDTFPLVLTDGVNQKIIQTISGALTVLANDDATRLMILSDAGELTLTQPLGRMLTLTAAAGNNRFMGVQSGGVDRWQWGADAAAESGGNVGSDFVVARFSDSGAFLGFPFLLNRASGDAVFSARVEAAATGASGKPLLNPVPISGTQTTANVAGGVTIPASVTLTGIPSSAVMVGMAFEAFLTAGSAFTTSWQGNSQDSQTIPVGNTLYGYLLCGVSNSIIEYTSGGIGTSTGQINFLPNIYWEES